VGTADLLNGRAFINIATCGFYVFTSGSVTDHRYKVLRALSNEGVSSGVLHVHHGLYACDTHVQTAPAFDSFGG
jgi:hypothetical protein